MATTTFPLSGEGPVAHLVAYVAPRWRVGVARRVWIGQQRIELHEFEGDITPSGQFFVRSLGSFVPGGGVYYRDPKPILARHADGKRLMLVHPGAREHEGKLPDGWHILEGEVHVELRGPKDSVLRVGGLTFPEVRAA